MWWNRITTYADNSVLYAVVVGQSVVLRYDNRSGTALTTVPFATEKDAHDWIEQNLESDAIISIPPVDENGN